MGNPRETSIFAPIVIASRSPTLTNTRDIAKKSSTPMGWPRQIPLTASHSASPVSHNNRPAIRSDAPRCIKIKITNIDSDFPGAPHVTESVARGAKMTFTLRRSASVDVRPAAATLQQTLGFPGVVRLEFLRPRRIKHPAQLLGFPIQKSERRHRQAVQAIKQFRLHRRRGRRQAGIKDVRLVMPFRSDGVS